MHLGEKLAQPIGLRSCQNLGGMALFDNDAAVHEDDAIGDFSSEADFVCDEQHRPFLGGKLADHAKNLSDQFRVERGGGLVEEEKLGTLRQSAGNRNTLLLPAREPLGILVSLFAEVDLCRAWRPRERAPLDAASSRP